MITFKIILGLSLALYYSDTFIQCDKSLELINVESNATDPDIIKVDFEYSRFNKTTFILSGKLISGKDFDDGTIVSGLMYYSAFGNDIYTLTPYGCPPQKISEFMNGFYKGIIQEALKDCADMMRIDDDNPFVAPFPKKVFNFTDCLVMTDIPYAITNGYYRLDVLIIIEDTVYGIFLYLKTIEW